MELHVNLFFPTKKMQDIFQSAVISSSLLNSQYISIVKGTVYFDFPNKPKSYMYNKSLEIYQTEGTQVP